MKTTLYKSAINAATSKFKYGPALRSVRVQLMSFGVASDRPVVAAMTVQFQFHVCHHCSGGKGYSRRRNPENVWLLNVLTGHGVSFPCGQCHTTLQDFIALEVPELALVGKCNEMTDYRKRLATMEDLPVYDINDAHATTKNENVTDNPLLSGLRTPSSSAIYEQRPGEPFLACAVRRKRPFQASIQPF